MSHKNGKTLVCEHCGGEFYRSLAQLKWANRFCSSDCYNKSGKNSLRHGHARDRTKTYVAWEHMLGRTTNPRDAKFPDYGGRGITVCERWRKYENFLEDMGESPIGLSLERLDNNGNYEPGNCCWATQAQQSRNTRRTVLVTIGDKTLCMKDWLVELGIGRKLFNKLYRSGTDAKVGDSLVEMEEV